MPVISLPSMRIFPVLPLVTSLFVAHAEAPPAADRMQRCNAGDAILAGSVTDARTKEPVRWAHLSVEKGPSAMADSVGCYAFRRGDAAAVPWRLRVRAHRYVELDTVLHPAHGRGVHLTLQPTSPACCRLEGEWLIRLTPDSVPAYGRPRGSEVEGRVVFSPRLPPARLLHDPAQEEGRFHLDLTTLLGEWYDPEALVPTIGPMAADFLAQAAGEVFADDSVHVSLIPGMTHGSVGMQGTIRGDSIRGSWVHNAYCCGAAGRFVMHRVPSSPAGDSLVEAGLRAMAEESRLKAARRAGHGFLRIRVWDTGTGRYVRVHFAAEGHPDNPRGPSFISGYASGEHGWGRVHSLEPGRYDLRVDRVTCGGRARIAETVDTDEGTPRFPVTIEAGRRVDKEIRLDVCAIHEAP